MKYLAPICLAAAMTYAWPASALEWRQAQGKSCEEACGGAHRTVTSGQYRNSDSALNGNWFFICMGDVGDGNRPGYNLKPNWANACWVAQDGQEKPVSNYSCLCR